jgi:hypothetical protein
MTARQQLLLGLGVAVAGALLLPAGQRTVGVVLGMIGVVVLADRHQRHAEDDESDPGTP